MWAKEWATTLRSRRFFQQASPPLSPKESQGAIFAAKRYVEEQLCKELNLIMAQVPLIIDAESDVNATSLRKQLEPSGQSNTLSFPYHKGIISGELPLSIGGGMGQ